MYIFRYACFKFRSKREVRVGRGVHTSKTNSSDRLKIFYYALQHKGYPI